jgi:RNA polymerase sigma-70 factor (ECF subfamily)
MATTPVSLLKRLHGLPQMETTAAWSEFLELYTPILFRWARRLGLQQSDAADLVQDVFVVLVRRLPEFEYDPKKSFRAWLRTILVNRWRDAGRRAAVLVEHVGHPALDELNDPHEMPDFAETEYREMLMRRALELMQREFKPTTWKACWEQLVEGRPAADVARDLGLTVNAVYVARSRVLRRLREYLDQLID